MSPTRVGALLLFAVASVCGCALTARKVSSPAAELTTEELARLPKPPNERYFLILFGSNDALHRPQYSHSWASLIRVPASEVGRCGPARPGCVDPALDVQTISWMPAKGTIDAWHFTVEPGRNFELHESMRSAYDTKQSVSYWGPYEVWYGFAHRFNVQKRFLDSGAVGYQCIDTLGEAARFGNGCDCIHGVTDMDPVYPRWRYPLSFYGKSATANLVRRLMHSPVWIDPPETHKWLMPRLGLDAYPLRERKYIGRTEQHQPGASTDLDVQSSPVPRLGPNPKLPMPNPDPR